MGLYTKKLRNVEDLAREKKRLRKKLHQLDGESGFVPESTDAREEKSNDGVLVSLLNYLPISNPLLTMGVQLLQDRVFNGKKKNGAAEKAEEPGKNWPKIIAMEFIGGYLKWKAIELSYKGVRYVIRQRRAAHEAAEKC